MIGFVGGVFLGLFLPSIYLGWETNWKFLNNWYELMIVNYQNFSAVRPYANNQTISAAFFKLFVPYSDLKQFLYGLPFPFFIHQLNLIKQIIQIVNLILLINLAIITALFIFKKTYTRTFFLYYLYLVFLTSLLTSGISWYHSYGILLVIFIFYYINRKKQLVFLLPSFYIWFLFLISSKIKDFLSLYSFYVWLNVGILIYLSIYLYKEFFQIRTSYET